LDSFFTPILSGPLPVPLPWISIILKTKFATIMSEIRRVTANLEKPDLDDRSYRVITLPNKLEALLVHDPDTDKASASLNVDVGNFSDEDYMPGMAHAIEHLLFMGTEKVYYPNICCHLTILSIPFTCNRLARLT
jgi:hypothetical protein